MSEGDLINLVQQVGHQFPQPEEGVMDGEHSRGRCPLSERLRFYTVCFLGFSLYNLLRVVGRCPLDPVRHRRRNSTTMW